MTTDRDESGLIRSWLDETYEAERDAQPFLDRMLDDVPNTQQRRRRWWPLPTLRRSTAPLTADHATDYQPTPIPASNGHSPTVSGRTQSMFSPVKAITAGALIFALGGVLLIAQPFDQQGEGVPGAQAEFAPPVEVTGTSVSPAGCTETDYDGPFEDTGVDANLWSCSTEAGMPWSFTDPRLEGVVTRTNEESLIVLGDASDVYIASSAFSIENDGGTWHERPRTWLLPDGLNTFDWLTDEVVVLDGTGDYDGLVAVLRATGPLEEFHGFIIDARWMPPAPENASTQ